MCFNTSLVIATSWLNLTLSGFGHCSSRLSHPEKTCFWICRRHPQRTFLKKGVHVKSTERSVIGQLHSFTYTHSIAIERILFQYYLLHLKDEPSKFRRNFMFYQSITSKKKKLVFTRIVLLHFLICVFKKGTEVLHLLKYVVTIDSSGQNLSVFLYKKDKGDSIMALGKADWGWSKKRQNSANLKIPHYYEKWFRAGRVTYSMIGETGETKMAPK